MTSGKWVLTDPDTEQYGRWLTDKVYQFKQPDINNGKLVVVDLDRYTNEQIEDVISAYGYTLLPSKGQVLNIYSHYEEEADWIIAECIFEMEEKPNKWL